MRVLLKATLMRRSAALLQPVSPLSSRSRSSGNGGGAGEVRCYRLNDRCVLNIRGPDTAPYLQGLITNDMHALKEPACSALHAHLLTVQGRTLYDVIIYRMKAGSDDLSAVLLECDASVQDAITRHLKTYRIRRNVSVEARTDLTLWSLLPLNPADPAHKRATPTPEPRLQDRNGAVLMVPDPRTQLMGWRLITGAHENPEHVIEACNHGNVEDYHRHRYTLGVPEGVRDLPPGDALPLESNLVFLNGISFSKGCYLGQELTARTHHTGVIRKRLMPVRLSVPAEDLPPGAALESEQGKPAGKLRAGFGRVGLGLVRLSHARETLLIRNASDRVTLTAFVPEWWSEDLQNKL